MVEYEARNASTPPIRVRWLCGGYCHWVHERHLRYLPPGTVVDETSGFVTYLPAGPAAAGAAEASLSSLVHNEAVGSLAAEAVAGIANLVRASASTAADATKIVELDCEVNAEALAVELPLLRTATHQLSAQVRMDSSRSSRSEYVEKTNVTQEPCSVASRRSIAESSCSNGGLIFNVEASGPNTVVVTGIECGHFEDCDFEVRLRLRIYAKEPHLVICLFVAVRADLGV